MKRFLMNPHYVASFPSDEFMLKFPESERSAWDPNDPKIFDVPQNAKWLRETYEKYIRRFYRDALKRWNKETGGGDGTPSCFIDYCQASYRWLAPIFCRDFECSFLLASEASREMPRHLQSESGFENDDAISCITTSTSSASVSTKCKNMGTINDDLINAFINQKKEHTIAVKEGMDKQQKSIEKLIDTIKQKEELSPMSHIKKINEELQDVDARKTFSPESSACWEESLRKKRRSLLNELD
mmetsp:Transcript_3061/g.4757  ORF Transcript_3061/g.4757 Transcript_3061/m.4757 type:complete len:242 (+) Transcript_3061:63-788(+)